MNQQPDRGVATDEVPHVENDDAPSRRRLPIVDASAPAERLAALRIAVGVFALVYAIGRTPVFLALTDRPEDDFDGVGILTWLSGPLPDAVFVAVLATAVASGVSFVLGWRYRLAGPLFALCMLVTTTFRGSWGQLLHFENLMVLQLLVLAPSPAADAWSLDARRRDAAHGGGVRSDRESVRYGWPIAIAGLVTVITYVIAGIAKLRYGGMEWVTGDTLRHHISYSAARLDLIGGTSAPLAEVAVRTPWVLPVCAAGAVVIELGAPVVWLGARWRNAWVACAWAMHAGIYLTMFVGFPSPLFGVAFAPFFALERVVPVVNDRVRRWWPARPKTARPSP